MGERRDMHARTCYIGESCVEKKGFVAQETSACPPAQREHPRAYTVTRPHYVMSSHLISLVHVRIHQPLLPRGTTTTKPPLTVMPYSCCNPPYAIHTPPCRCHRRQPSSPPQQSTQTLPSTEDLPSMHAAGHPSMPHIHTPTPMPMPTPTPTLMPLAAEAQRAKPEEELLQRGLQCIHWIKARRRNKAR